MKSVIKSRSETHAVGSEYAAAPAKRRLQNAAIGVAAVAGLLSTGRAMADATWTGGVSQNWNDTANNWTQDPSGQNVFINTATGNYPIVAATPTFTPVDIFVGRDGGNTGRLDSTAGTLATGAGNWIFVGSGSGGTGTYNLANTATTGGTTTGYGLGSGSLSVGRLNVGGGEFNGTGTGVVNINTSGTINAYQGDFGLYAAVDVGEGAGSNGTMNLDNGAVSLTSPNGAAQFFVGNNGGTGTLNMAGGSVTTPGIFIVGRVGGTGTLNQTGGTIAAVNNEVWFCESIYQNFGGGTGTIGAGASLTAGTYFVIGRSGTNVTGHLTLNGGTIAARTGGQFGNLEIGVFDSVNGLLDINANSTVKLQSNCDIILGSANTSGNGTVNQNAGNVTFFSDAGTTAGGTGKLYLGFTANGYASSSGAYTYNLNGGSIALNAVTRTGTAGSGTLNFNGGTLIANGDSTDLISNLTRANVRNGAAVINTNGHGVTINQALLHSDVAGDNAIDGGLTKSGAGTLTITAANTYTGPTTVTAGTLRANGAAYSNFLSNSGGLDVGGGSVVLDYSGTTSPVASVKSILTAGYPNFTTGQIRSSSTVANRTIGYGDNGTGEVRIMTTLGGDANLDGMVDFNDFLVLQTNFGNAGTRFDQGNFNYDNVTDFNDFLILQTNFGRSISGNAVAYSAAEFAAIMSITSASNLPEPTTLAVIGIGAGAMLRRRRNG